MWILTKVHKDILRRLLVKLWGRKLHFRSCDMLSMCNLHPCHLYRAKRIVVLHIVTQKVAREKGKFSFDVGRFSFPKQLGLLLFPSPNLLLSFYGFLSLKTFYCFKNRICQILQHKRVSVKPSAGLRWTGTGRKWARKLHSKSSHFLSFFYYLAWLGWMGTGRLWERKLLSESSHFQYVIPSLERGYFANQFTLTADCPSVQADEVALTLKEGCFGKWIAGRLAQPVAPHQCVFISTVYVYVFWCLCILNLMDLYVVMWLCK